MAYEFDKQLLFRNLEYLLGEKNMGIGDFEEKAGVSTGFCARSKKDQKSKPGIDFIMKASDILNVSVDSLLTVDYSVLTPTEKYTVGFLGKLNKDTVEDKLNWKTESSDYLNHLELDENGIASHPLFKFESFLERSEENYEEVTRVIFESRNYGYQTYIEGDCYNLRLKNDTYLYLMNISKSVHRTDDKNAYSKEIWLFSQLQGKQFLCDNWGERTTAALVDTLYEAVKENSKHPKIDKAFRSSIDAYMNDDFVDDNVNYSPVLVVKTKV